ncbi:M20/M25/M40 family metallo-hydrolase [Gemmatimonas sp.]|uniref:M20/M25/M40 family metallo-hydrolase n=1 Tax=Gemmatimonas sp. TaxID=1962908 RepID=UPI0022BB4F21|nr:M20/M25/M40 family metallo-hydrolase [Gemmatimonas sp.]MCZ8204059.1 M20/M25/M40 family metallo-hydrolase [Gemmatimonas sp.]
MLSDSSIAFLKRLLDTPGPSGFEGAPARVWRAEAATFAADIRADVVGNSLATAEGDGTGPTILLAGHIDEIGIIITHIDDKGYVYFEPIGGWDPQVLVAQRIRFLGRHGDVIGVIGKKPIHLMKPDEREKASKITDLWVDIGVTTKAEALELLEVGDAGVIDSRSLDMPNNRLVSRSIDDRIGAFVVLEALRRYAARPGAARVVAAATAQEEIGYSGGGARVAAQSVEATMAVAVDVTFATDHPGMKKEEVGEHSIGGGPVLTRGSVTSPVVYRLLAETAKSLEIPFSIHAAGRFTSTDADAMQLARTGVATALVSIPNRYMHSPNEMVSLDDLDRAAELIAETCRRVTAATDFTAR